MFVSKKRFNSEVAKRKELEEHIAKLERQVTNLKSYSHRLREYNYHIKLGIDIGTGVDLYASSKKES